MHEQLISYFEGEKQGALIFGAVGLLAVLISAMVWRWSTPYRAMIFPLLLIGAIEIGVCIALQARTDAQVARLTEQLRTDPAAMRAAELARITRVNTSFRVVEVVEVVLWIAGAVLVFAFRHSQAAFSVGLGLILQTSAILAMDLIAERRAHVYTAALNRMPDAAPR